MIHLAMLAVCSGLSLNSLFQFALNFRGPDPAHAQGGGTLPLRAAALFISSLLPWFLMSYVVAPLALGAIEPLVLYPATALVCSCASKILRPLENESSYSPSAWNSYDGLALFSAFITLRLATFIPEALVVAAGLALGHLAATGILRRISSRSSIEPVPAFLRGTPLLMISAGLVSLVSSFAAAILLRALKDM